MTAAAVLLAGGSGTRFGSENPKLLADLNGKPVVRWAIESARASGLPALYVVTGAVDLTAVSAEATLVPNDQWAEGLASSLQAGIAAARVDGHDAVVVALADQPHISPEAWRAVAAATGTAIAVATYEGKRGHPVRLAHEVWSDLPRSGEDGARALMRERPELVTEVPCTSGSSRDIDTAEDLDRFNSPTRSA